MNELWKCGDHDAMDAAWPTSIILSTGLKGFESQPKTILYDFPKIATDKESTLETPEAKMLSSAAIPTENGHRLCCFQSAA
jgi:hypothetical protein